MQNELHTSRGQVNSNSIKLEHIQNQYAQLNTQEKLYREQIISLTE